MCSPAVPYKQVIQSPVPFRGPTPCSHETHGAASAKSATFRLDKTAYIEERGPQAHLT